MKKTPLIAMLFLILTGLTGCIDIIEELYLNKDGSGQYKRSIDMSEMSSMLQAFQKEAGDNASGGEFDEMTKSLTGGWDAVSKVRGISNVKIDSANHVYKIQYDFSNIDALNNAANAEKGNESSAPVFKFKKNEITRSGDNSLSSMANEEEIKESLEMGRDIFREMDFTYIYHLPAKARSVSNKKAVVSKEKKTVTLRTNMLELIEKKTTVDVTIKY